MKKLLENYMFNLLLIIISLIINKKHYIIKIY